MARVADLVPFLRARYDEEEQAALTAATLCGCHPPALAWSFRDGDEPTDGRILVVDDPHPRQKRKIGRRWNGSYEGLAMAEHIVRHDPAHVLADLKGKRAVLDAWGDRDYDVPDYVIEALAEPHKHHPDYPRQ